jgi:molecular chaperone Hsp33
VVPLHGDRKEKLEHVSEVLEHYMLQSEQLDTTLVLAANEHMAAGLLIQRLPLQGEANLAGSGVGRADEDEIGRNEDYNRIAILAKSLKREELLGLDADTILHRLFWEEQLLRFAPQDGAHAPRFACTCSRERVSGMLRSLGREEVESILAEQGQVEVACDFCGAQYRYDPVDAASVFLQQAQMPPGSSSVQ